MSASENIVTTVFLNSSEISSGAGQTFVDIGLGVGYNLVRVEARDEAGNIIEKRLGIWRF